MKLTAITTILVLAASVTFTRSRVIEIAPPLRVNLTVGSADIGATPPASDDEWSKCSCKGGSLLAGMLESDEEAGQRFVPPRARAQSEFKDFPNEFTKWNYHQILASEFSEQYIQFDEFWGIGTALRDLHVSDKAAEVGGLNTVTYTSHGDIYLAYDEHNPVPFHQQTYRVADQKYRATGAYFALSMNYDDGVIIAMNRLSPTFATKDANPAFSTAELPALSASSDVTWGLWQYAKPGKLENPRFFFSASITNEQTLRIISRALANDGKALEHWPGATFLPNEEDFRALLGTPNGIGLGFFLMQHKAELGNMYVSSVNVFKDDTRRESPVLCFRITKDESRTSSTVNQRSARAMALARIAEQAINIGTASWKDIIQRLTRGLSEGVGESVSEAERRNVLMMAG